MSCLISFATSMFDVSTETPNPINPIAGQSLLRWLRESIAPHGFESTEPDAEDWGWFMTATNGEAAYMVGASSDMDDEEPQRSWSVQIEKHRTLVERILGRNKMVSDDPLCMLIEKLVRAESRFKDVEVDRTS